jgi:hypothetical protein
MPPKRQREPPDKIRTSADIKNIIEERTSELRERYQQAHSYIDWTDSYTCLHFASESEWITQSEKSRLMKYVSDSWLRMKLSDHIPEIANLRYNRNMLLEHAVTYGILSQEVADRNLQCLMKTVKCYLWTIVDVEKVSAAMRDYARICSQIMIRGR